MKYLLRAVIAVFFLMGMISYVYAIHETIPSETQVPLPGPDAGKLYDYIAKYQPYTSWEMWPGKGKLYKGREPHGALLATYVNAAAHASIREMKGMADSSIIVKENYSDAKILEAITVLYKIAGYNPSAGDWFWAKYDASGKALASGKVDACISCHGANKDNDFIFTGKTKK